MGTRSPVNVYDPASQQLFSTAFASYGPVIQVGGNDEIMIHIDLTNGASLSTVDLAFLVDGRPLMRASADGTAFERDTLAYSISSGLSFCFPFNTRGAKTLQIQAKANVDAGSIESIDISQDGTNTITPKS